MAITADHSAFRRADFDADVLLAERGRDASLARTVSGILLVLGYGECWQNTHLRSGTVPLPPKVVRAPGELVAELLVLLARVGDTPATPESTGQTEQEIAEANRIGRSRRAYYPAAYDGRLRLLRDAIPPRGHRRSGPSSSVPVGAQCELKLRALELVLRHRCTAPTVAEQMRIPHWLAKAATDQIGLRTRAAPAGGLVLAEIKPGQDATIAAVREALDRFYVDRDDPVQVWADLVAATTKEVAA